MSISLPEFSSIKILVVGDLMLDRYWSGDTQRISPEAPVPVVSINDFEERPGGAGNVARSITKLGGVCKLVALLGDDGNGSRADELLQNENVSTQFVKDIHAKTISKLRVLSRHQQLIRLDFESEFTDSCISELTQCVKEQIKNHQVIILSDYNKGALRDVKEIISYANSNNVYSFVDPKGNDFSKYRDVTAITPNQSEFQAVVGSIASEGEFISKGINLLKELNLSALIVTRSEKGVTLIQDSGENVTIPARAKEVYDVTGAGDTFISVLASSYAAGSSFEHSVQIANAASSVVVGKLGAATVSKNEIEGELNRSSQLLGKIVSLEVLIQKVRNLRQENKKIVMTNGCFDILHSGHVDYLSKARQMGDVLIVAVNSDESVRTIKGNSRPVNTANDRMTVLSGLHAVDWLVEFDQETPEAVIKELLPDILVKGGDYKPEEVVGGDTVCANGGEVRIVEFLGSYSTSNLISKITNS